MNILVYKMSYWYRRLLSLYIQTANKISISDTEWIRLTEYFKFSFCATQFQERWSRTDNMESFNGFCESYVSEACIPITSQTNRVWL
jgi:hypothetical protein